MTAEMYKCEECGEWLGYQLMECRCTPQRTWLDLRRAAKDGTIAERYGAGADAVMPQPVCGTPDYAATQETMRVLLLLSKGTITVGAQPPMIVEEWAGGAEYKPMSVMSRLLLAAHLQDRQDAFLRHLVARWPLRCIQRQSEQWEDTYGYETALPWHHYPLLTVAIGMALGVR